MGTDFLVAFDDFSRRYWPLLMPAVFLAAWLFHYSLFRQQLRIVLRRLRKHQITGRKGRQQLQESEERLRIILSAIQTGVAVVNPVTRVIEFVNPAACKMIGLGKEKINGRRIEEFEVKEGDEELEEFRGLGSRGENVRHRELLRSTGEHFPVLEKVVPITINGSVFILKTYQDLTDVAITRRQVERLHTNLTKRVQELHCLFGVAGFLGDPSLTEPEVMDEICRILPLAMQFPHLAGAKVYVENYEARTENYEATPWQLGAHIEVGGERRGGVEISYLEHPPVDGERLFSPEEQALVETVCSRLARYLAGQEAARDRALFKGLMDHTSNAVFVFEGQTGALTYVNMPGCHMLGMLRQELLSRDFEAIFSLDGGMEVLRSHLEEEGVGSSKDIELGLFHDETMTFLPQSTCLLLGEDKSRKIAVLVNPQYVQG